MPKRDISAARWQISVDIHPWCMYRIYTVSCGFTNTSNKVSTRKNELWGSTEQFNQFKLSCFDCSKLNALAVQTAVRCFPRPNPILYGPHCGDTEKAQHSRSLKEASHEGGRWLPEALARLLRPRLHSPASHQPNWFCSRSLHTRTQRRVVGLGRIA